MADLLPRHPFGMTGSRLTGHIIREQNRDKQFGVVTMCVGGMGAAGLLEDTLLSEKEHYFIDKYLKPLSIKSRIPNRYW